MRRLAAWVEARAEVSAGRVVRWAATGGALSGGAVAGLLAAAFRAFEGRG